MMSQQNFKEQLNQLPVELFTDNKQDIGKVFRDLIKWKLCTKCCFRFLGEEQACVYQKPQQVGTLA